MNAVVEALDVRRLTESYLEDGLAQPAEMAERALRDLGEDELREVFASALAGAFREQIHRRRKSLFRSGRSSRLEAAALAHRIFIQPEAIGEVMKPLGECTRDDILTSASAYRERAANETREAKRREALGKLMQSRKVELVKDLDAAEVLDALSS